MSSFNVCPPSSAKYNSFNPRRRWLSVAKSALGVAVAMGALAAGQARAASSYGPSSIYMPSPIYYIPSPISDPSLIYMPSSIYMPSPTYYIPSPISDPSLIYMDPSLIHKPRPISDPSPIYMPSPTTGQAQAARIYEPSPMQTFGVDSRTNVFPIGQPKVSSAILDAGVWYKFVVTGEWTPDYKYGPFSLEQLQANPALLAQVPWRADARLATEDTWETNSDFDPKNYDDFGLHSSFIGAGDDDFWGASNAIHSYEYEVLGSAQSADFYVQDVNYGDNFGGYTVKLFRAADVSPASVPGPLPALGAAAAFGFSRKLRKRIKGSTNALSSSYSL